MSGYTASDVDMLLLMAPHEPNRLSRFVLEQMMRASVAFERKQPADSKFVQRDVFYSYRERPRSISPKFRNVRFYVYYPDGPQKKEMMDLWALKSEETEYQLFFCVKRCAVVIEESAGIRALSPDELLRLLGATEFAGHRAAAIKAITLVIDAAA